MNLTETINKRKSIRKFQKTQISKQELEQILEAGTLAPSAKNRQPWFFYVINDSESKKDFLISLKNGFDNLLQKNIKDNIQRPDIENAYFTLESMKQASSIIIVLCQRKYKETYDDGIDWYLHATDIEVSDILSIGASVENMILKATEMGYGTLWICDIFYAYSEISRFLKTQDAIVSAVCIGKADENPPKRLRIPVTEVCNFYAKE